MESKKTDAEVFRDGLDDLIKIAEVMKPFCKTLDELIEVCSLAVSNDAQLNLIMSAAMGKKK